MRRHLIFCAVLMLSCWQISGCTIGPRVKSEFVIVRPGHPCEILENKTVRARRLNDQSIVRQDVGGWVAMPAEHWEAIVRALTRAQQAAPPKYDARHPYTYDEKAAASE